MDEHARKAAIRFVQSLDRIVDEEYFSEDDCWSVMRDLLEEYARLGRHLNIAQVATLTDFGNTIGIRPGGPLHSYKPIIEGALGPPPSMNDADLDALYKWAYGEVNASFEMKVPDKVVLDAEPNGPVPPPRKPLWS